MKVAVISDIHGNRHALEAVLDELGRLRVDRIVCGGDVPNPLLSSGAVWARLKGLGIPCIRGNHEDYIASYWSGDRPEIRESVQFRPTQECARALGPELARELAALPLELDIPGPGGDPRDSLYVCHASPLHNARSVLAPVDPPMAEALGRIPSRMIATGHIHTQWHGWWKDKNLILCGSVGLPHHGKPEAEFAVFTFAGGRWRCDLRTVPYDSEAAAREYLESGAVARGGPIAWMLYDELVSAEPRLALFLPIVLARGPDRPVTLQDWARDAEAYLRSIGRWAFLDARGVTGL